MNRISILLISLLWLLASCTPNVYPTIYTRHSSLDRQEVVRVFERSEIIPENAEFLGRVKVQGVGFSIKCSFNEVVNLAKAEARRVGGNAIQITHHSAPNSVSPCHNIIANIYKIDGLEMVPNKAPVDSALNSSEYATLHIYRKNGEGSSKKYDLYLDNTLICRAQNRWKESIKITQERAYILWVETEEEEKLELPITIQLGKEYYIRCSVKMEIYVGIPFPLGQPKIELVDNLTGKREFDAILEKKKK